MNIKAEIINEINELPAEKLEELYEFVHALNLKNIQANHNAKGILSFAGSFSDMKQKDYNDFKKYVKQTRVALNVFQ